MDSHNQSDSVKQNYQAQLDDLTNKYDTAVKEKMLMKLEKDRVQAKVDNLAHELLQRSKASGDVGEGATSAHSKAKPQTKKREAFKMTGEPSNLPVKDRPNPWLSEHLEPTSSHLSCQKTFKGHLMGVTSLAYNPKKDILATGSDDTTWKLWSIPNGDLIMSGEGHLDWIGGLDFHPRGNLLATASGDGTVKLWDFVNASCCQTWQEHGQPVWKVAFHDTGDFLLSCSMDHSVKLWDMNLKKSRFTFRGHVDSVNSISFAPYSNKFVSGSGDKTVSVWDLRVSTCVQTYYGHNNSVNCTKFDFCGEKIISSDSDGITKVWDQRMVKQIHSFDSGLTSANSCIFDKSNTNVYVASDDNTIKVFNVNSGEKEAELKGHEDSVLDLCWDNQKEGASLVSGGSDCSFRLWG